MSADDLPSMRGPGCEHSRWAGFSSEYLPTALGQFEIEAKDRVHGFRVLWDGCYDLKSARWEALALDVVAGSTALANAKCVVVRSVESKHGRLLLGRGPLCTVVPLASHLKHSTARMAAQAVSRKKRAVVSFFLGAGPNVFRPEHQGVDLDPGVAV
jgi:hypothetical protein